MSSRQASWGWAEAAKPRVLWVWRRCLKYCRRLSENTYTHFERRPFLIFIFPASQKDIYSPNNGSFLILELWQLGDTISSMLSEGPHKTWPDVSFKVKRNTTAADDLSVEGTAVLCGWRDQSFILRSYDIWLAFHKVFLWEMTVRFPKWSGSSSVCTVGGRSFTLLMLSKWQHSLPANSQVCEVSVVSHFPRGV